MKILFVTPYLPSPPRFGAQRRLDGLMRGLAREHEVSLLSFRGSDGDPEASLTATREYCARLETVDNDVIDMNLREKRLLQLRSLLSPRSFEYLLMQKQEFQARLDLMRREVAYDVIQVEFSQMALYDFQSGAARSRLVLDEHNIEYELLKRTGDSAEDLSRKVYSLVNWRKLKREERDAWRRFDGVLLTSARDERLLRDDEPATRTAVIPNAVDLEAFQPSDVTPDPDSLLFFGAMNYHPNIDGVGYFLDEILPHVTAERPAVQLRIVGQNPPPSIVARNGPNVQVVGFVDDPRPLLTKASVLVVPLRIGGGTRFKIVEGMAQGKAIVSTRLGAEGLDVVHERHLLLADEPRDFARQVNRLLSDPALAARLGQAARQLAEQRYGWRAAVERLLGFYEELAPPVAGRN